MSRQLLSVFHTSEYILMLTAQAEKKAAVHFCKLLLVGLPTPQ